MIEAWADTERQTGTITEIEGPEQDGSYSINWSKTPDDKGIFWCGLYSETDGDKPAPQIGDTVTLWGRGGLGATIRGQAVNGVVWRYVSAEGLAAQNIAELAAKDAKLQTEYAAERDDYDVRIAALPAVFRQRIHDFRSRRSDWGWNFEKYELFVCEQAVIFATTLRTPDALQAFHGLDHAAQKAACPEMADDHSGNTFGKALNLAYAYLTEPESIPQHHGALCPLVGCQDYGCWATVAG